MFVESPEKENKLGTKAVTVAPWPLSVRTAQWDLEVLECSLLSKWNNSAENSNIELKVIFCLVGGVSFWYYLLCGGFFLFGWFFGFRVFLGVCMWLWFSFYTHGFSHFYPSDSLPNITRASVCVGLSCQVELIHNNQALWLSHNLDVFHLWMFSSALVLSR